MPTDHPLYIYRYLDRSNPGRDSQRFRNRVAAAFTLGEYSAADVAKALKARAGIVIRAQYGYLWDEFWSKGEIAEVFTAITVAAALMRAENPTWAKSFVRAVKAALNDEHLSYRIDDDGVVHFAVDEEFEVVRLSTLQGLDNPLLKDCRDAYESAHRYMDSNPPDTRQAVRRVFEAVELVARQLAPTHKNLHAGLCRGELKATCVPVLTGDGIEKQVLDLMFNGMAEWVSGLHFYRHGQPESAPPSLDTAVFALTTGAGYLRLLAEVAVKALPKASAQPI